MSNNRYINSSCHSCAEKKCQTSALTEDKSILLGNYNTCKICDSIITNKGKLGLCKSCSKLGELNPKWKGENVTYRTIHQWANRNVPKPLTCPGCKETKELEVCNISGVYKKEITDWKWLCRKCHMQEDGRLERAKSKMLRWSRFNKNKRDTSGKFISKPLFSSQF